MILFEDRSTYSPMEDAVTTATLSVECNPGQVANVLDFLTGVAKQAGVYSVTMDTITRTPEKLPEPAVAPAAEQVAVPTADAETLLSASAAADEKPAVETAQGETHGEPTIQPEHIEPEAAGDGEGKTPEESGAATALDAGTDSELAGTAGTSATAGS